MTPRNRYLRDMNKVKLIPSELLGTHFLHRVTRKVNNDSTIQLDSKYFEVPQKFIGQRLNIRYLPCNTDKAFIFNQDNVLIDTIYSLKRVDNSKVRRNVIDYSKMNGGDINV